MTASFIFLSASTKKSEAAIAGGGFFLSSSLGEVAGMSVQSAILQATLKRTLESKLTGVEGSAEIIRHVTSSVSNMWLLPRELQNVITGFYLQGLGCTHVFSLACALSVFLLAFTAREHTLDVG
ncbi:hypothetical protein GJ744_008678 [Endocarpon pusillum]|uniref:Major facilitator superfamily (MFS) profile domain-containing protein n=1 Tax=Endocarpon pusillum TaxID=364733 RepID=A0A8H7AKJ9_9EURO|nr:hypothetical protein GJ744_008678 [Endocarpon pusillum]